MGNENSTSELPAAVHTDKVSALKEKSPATENGSVHPESVTAEPQVSADEEEKTGRQEEEDKEELEFPHDLLPSIDLDLSAELSLTWGTTLGREQVGLGEMKNEAVALGGSANPLLAGLEHYMEASPSVVGLMKSCDDDQVSTETALLTKVHLPSAPQQDVPSVNPLAVQVDYELQEALKQCEDEMAALGISSLADTWTAGDLDRCFPLVLPESEEKNEQTKMPDVKEDFDSSSHKHIEFYQGCHGNDGAHINDSTAGEEGVFSFRDYVLGKDLANTCTAETKDVIDIKNITENPGEEASQLSEAEKQTKSEIERKIDTAESIADQHTTHSTWTGTQTASETDAVKEALTQDQSIQDSCISKYSLDEESMQYENRIHVVSGVTQETHLVNKEVVSSAMNTDMHRLACPYTDMDKHAGDTWHLEAKISVQPNIQKQVESGTRQPISGQIETNMKVGSSLEIRRQELRLPEQLSLEAKQLICSPPSVPEVHQAHLSLGDAPPDKIPHPPQGPEQHEDQDQTDGPCKSISEGETIHHCTTGEVKHEKNVSDASAVVIDFCKAETALEYELRERFDLETHPPEQENGPALGSGAGAQAPVWGNSQSLSRARTEEEEEEEESALERASAESAASTLLQTTPTMPEMIESEGEKKRDDAFQSAAIIVQAAERELAVLDADESPSSEGTLSEITAEEGQQCTLLIFPKINCSPAQIEETTVESCGNKIPLKSTENEREGGGLPAALSIAGDKDTGTVSTQDKALVTYSSPGVLGTCDWKVESCRLEEKKGDSEKEEKETSEGGAQNAAHAGRVSQIETVTETCPSHRITASPEATQDGSDLIHPVTGTAPFALTINRINDCDSISSPPPLFHINSSEREAQREDKANLNSSPSASGAELPGSDLLLPPAVSSETERLAVQANNQQVQSALQTESANCDTREDTSQSTKLQENMRDIKAPKGMQSSFDDQKDAALKRQMTECASLPPLMVFENLRHPVKEASFNFKGFLSISKAALPSQTEPEKGQRNTVLDVIEEEKSSEKNETTAPEEGRKEGEGGKVEIACIKPKDCTDTFSASQDQGETTVNISGCEESGKVTDETASKRNPVISLSLSAADETINVTDTRDVANEAIKDKQENKESFNITQMSTNDRDESASTEKISALIQDVLPQDARNCSLAVDGLQAEIAVSESDEQMHTEVLQTSKENLIEETDEFKKYGLSEEHESKSEEESQVKAALDTDSTCAFPDKDSSTEQPTITLEMPQLSKADKYADVGDCQTESQFSDEMMKSDAAVLSLPAVENTVPAQRDLSTTTTQSTNSVARDVSVIVLKAPGPMLSHCESISDCDIAVAETVELCSVNRVCESDPEVLKSITDKMNLQADANEDSLRKQNTNDPSYIAGVSAQETAASSGSLLLTADRTKQAGGSLLMSNNPDIVRSEDNEASIGTVELDIVREEKRETCVNSNLCRAPTNAITDDNVVNEDTPEELRNVKEGGHNKECVKETDEKYSTKQDGNGQKNMEQDEKKKFREQKDSREKINTSEVSCADKMLHSQATLMTHQIPNDDINHDSVQMHLEDKLGTILVQSVDNVRMNTNVSEGFRHSMSEDQNKEGVQENEERTSCPQEQDETLAKENMDQTQRENQALNIFKLSEDNLLNETISKEKSLSSSVPEPDLTFKGIMEETVGYRGEPTEKSPPVIDQTISEVLNAFPERDHTQDLKALSQSDLAFSQSHNLLQQQKFTSAPEAVLSEGKSYGAENAETNNHADAEASEKQEEVTVCCTAESVGVVGGNHKDDDVYNICPQNEYHSLQTKDLPSSEIQTSAPNLSVNATSEASEFKKEVPETKDFASVNKHEECTNSQVSVDEYGNVRNKILDTKKEAELPVNPSSGFTVSPSLSHHEEGLKTDENCFGFVTPGDTGNTEIRPDSVSEVAQMPAAESSQLQQEKELVFQPSDGQCITGTSIFSASVIEESIKEEKETSVDQAPKDEIEPKSTPKSETAVSRMEQLNKHLSEQFPDGTQNTEEQHTQCSEQQLTQLLHVRTCSGTENKIVTMKAENTSNDRQEPQGIQEETSKSMGDEEMSVTTGKYHMEMSEGTGPKSSEYVGKERISKKSQSKVEEDSSSPSMEAIVFNVDQPIEIATDGTLIEINPVVSLSCPETTSCLVADPQDSLQPPLTENQQSIQQPTTTLIQSLGETTTDTVTNTSEQKPEDTKEIQKNVNEANEEKVDKVSEAEDAGAVQVSQVKDSSDSLGAVSVPDRSNKANSSEDSDWLRDLKEAASMSQIIPEHKDETTCGSTENRPFETLGSPQAELEFRTPTEEYLPPAPEESFPPGPEDSFPPAPEDCLPFVSEDSFPLAPEDCFPPPPEESFPPAPEEIFPPAPEESFPPIAEQPEESSDYRSPLVEAAEWCVPVPSPSSLPPQHYIAPALPSHLLPDTVEFPTPPPTPPDRAPAELETFPPAPAPSDLPQIPPDVPLPPPVQQLQHSEPSAR